MSYGNICKNQCTKIAAPVGAGTAKKDT